MNITARLEDMDMARIFIYTGAPPAHCSDSLVVTA